MKIYVHKGESPTLVIADASPPMFGVAEVKDGNIDFVSFSIPAAVGEEVVFEVQIERAEWNAAIATLEQHMERLHAAMKEHEGVTKQ